MRVRPDTGKQPMGRARVFSMDGKETKTAEGPIKGMCFVNKYLCEVLFDSGTTYSLYLLTVLKS